MVDLQQMSGVEAIAWLTATFGDAMNPRSTSRAGDPRHVALLCDHGLSDTTLIETEVRLAAKVTGGDTLIAAGRPEVTGPLATLPTGYPIAPEELLDFAYVGGPAWVEDEENRAEWAAVGRAAWAHEESMVDRRDENDLRIIRRTPSGKARYGVAPHEIVTAIHAAGRGPSYARAIIERATLHGTEIDAFGFGPNISPGVYADLASAGITRTADLDAYLAAGLSLPEAVTFRADGIAAAAVLMARAEGHDPATWHYLLLGLPAEWFRPLGDDSHSRHDAQESYRDGLTHYLRSGGSDRYRLEDLRYLVERGWTGKDTLTPYGLTDLAYSRTRDITDENRYAAARIARELAEHHLTWKALEKYAEALTIGKAPQHKADTTRAPLIGWNRGRGPAAIPSKHLPEVYALAEAGVKPSHLASYRKAGCASPEQVLEARAAGITAKHADTLCRIHGRQPEPRWHKNTYVIDEFLRLMAAWKSFQRNEANWEKIER